ncbi:biogenesis of lysosome-related organelles complex 1 subunit 5-like [Stylophora pistillata]|uniref:biogenesis of lysosome-related organelles complex 1 subunit 5-like n=1 Tax=Stylophora pistillata TaxID=50429 RepID=UPI000C039892|nr:biogenesis of lysosome-related organelles complex 1 subunit 5-like [Stylophora pistillata]
MAGEKAVRDVCGVYSRLFDHRAILQNECKYVIREFEGKRNDRDLSRLTEASQRADEIQSKIPECIQLADLLNDVQDQLKDARQRCHNILEREDQDPTNMRRDEIKEKSKKQWDVFLKEMDKEEEGIEKEFLAKSLKLKEKYGLIATTEST